MRRVTAGSFSSKTWARASVSVEQFLVGVGGGGEAGRHTQAGRGQLSGQLSEGGVLAADPADVASAERGERYDASRVSHDVLRWLQVGRDQYGKGRPDGVRRSSGAGLRGCVGRVWIRMRCIVVTHFGRWRRGGVRVPRSRGRPRGPQCRGGHPRGPIGPLRSGADRPRAPAPGRRSQEQAKDPRGWRRSRHSPQVSRKSVSPHLRTREQATTRRHGRRCARWAQEVTLQPEAVAHCPYAGHARGGITRPGCPPGRW